jgi:hypothetical protein
LGRRPIPPTLSSIKEGVSIFSNWIQANNNIKASTIPICFFEKNWQSSKTYSGFQRFLLRFGVFCSRCRKIIVKWLRQP